MYYLYYVANNHVNGIGSFAFMSLNKMSELDLNYEWTVFSMRSLIKCPFESNAIVLNIMTVYE